MKKLLFLITMALLFPTIAWSQNWVPLTKTEPAEPEIAIIQSDNRQVGFTVELSGFFSTLITEARVNYQRLSISGYGVTGETGTPEIPVIRKRIAIPVCDKIHYSVQVIESQILAGYRVYPVPKLQPDTTGMLQEVFTIKPSVYLQNAPIPAESYLLGETGALRHQHYVELEIHPIQFNPVTEQLQVATAMEIILTFDKPVTDVNVPTGIFNKVAATSFMNYKDNGWSAIMNDKAFEKDGFKPGNVEWINLIDTAQACQITADYLIITVPEFFTPNDPHSQLIRLANHRAYYNGYDVAIVNLEQILELDFYYEGSSNSWEPFDKYIKEQRMRTFIRRVFEGANAHHVGADSCLAFVLLVGDNYGENEGMPTGKEHGIYWFDSSNEIYASDYYFTCITKNAAGKYDSDGDFWIGRFSVEDTTQLFNLVQKNINHETEYSPKFWRETAGSTSAWQFNTMLPTYHNFITNLLDNCGWNYVPVIGLNSSTPLK
ncbi:MAG: C25 family cysteine peptidase, partial [Lentimicrobiaceae bacterium]|nr:C25 family cysteine peptidase [Lentimicrobiaceae bacterium]